MLRIIGEFINTLVSCFKLVYHQCISLLYLTSTRVDSTKEAEVKEEKVHKLTGIQRLVRVLKKHGIQFIFCLTGSDIYPILVEIDKEGIQVIDVRNEATAVYAARATGRMTGIPGIVIVSAGAGVTNTVSGAMDAKFDEVPLIIFGGAPATVARGIGSLHDIDHLAVMAPVCKKVFSVETTEDMIPILKKGFQIAASDTPGPVFISLPVDVLAPYTFQAPQFNLKFVQKLDVFQQMKSGYKKIWKEYVLRKRLDQVIAQLPVHIPKATSNEILTSAEILLSAKKPLIIVGSQVTLSPQKLFKVPIALKSMGIPCYLYQTAKGLLGRSNELWIQYDMAKALSEADVVILAGRPCDYLLRFGLDLPKYGKIITVGRNKATLTLGSPRFWRPTQVICSDVGKYLVRLSVELKKTTFVPNPNWIQTCREISDEKESYIMKKANERTKAHLNPLKMLIQLDQVTPENVIYVNDAGDFGLSAREMTKAPSPLSFIDYGVYANVGCGVGLAIGIKLCRPNSQVWLISGDGAIGYNITEFDSCVRHKIPIMSLVGNDAAFNEIARQELKEFGTTIGAKLEYSKYHSIAIDLGAKGILLDRNNEVEIEEKLLSVQKMNTEGFSVLVNVLIGTTNIRDGLA